jgi:hypothetical protein
VAQKNIPLCSEDSGRDEWPVTAFSSRGSGSTTRGGKDVLEDQVAS